MRSNIALLIFTKCFFYGFDIFLRYSVCRCVVIFEENIHSEGFQVRHTRLPIYSVFFMKCGDLIFFLRYSMYRVIFFLKEEHTF